MRIAHAPRAALPPAIRRARGRTVPGTSPSNCRIGVPIPHSPESEISLSCAHLVCQAHSGADTRVRPYITLRRFGPRTGYFTPHEPSRSSGPEVLLAPVRGPRRSRDPTSRGRRSPPAHLRVARMSLLSVIVMTGSGVRMRPESVALRLESSATMASLQVTVRGVVCVSDTPRSPRR